MRRRTIAAVAAVVLAAAIALLPARAARAQVNVESLRGDFRATSARAVLEGAFTGRLGNVDSAVAGAAATGVTKVGRHDFFGTIQGDYARFDQKTSIAKSFIHLRYSFRLLEWLRPEAYLQQQQDRIQRLRLRELAGLGPRFVLLDEEDVRIAFGTSYMFEYERISVPTGAPDPPESTAHRWSNYVALTWELEKRVRFVSTIYAQPRWDDFGDTRVLYEATLVDDFAKRLTVKLVFTMRHDSEPPTTVKPTDIEVKNAIGIRF